MEIIKNVIAQANHIWADHKKWVIGAAAVVIIACLLYTSPSPRDQRGSRMPSSA